MGRILTWFKGLYVMFSCVFVTFPYGVLGQVWHLILSIPDLCPLLNLVYQKFFINYNVRLFSGDLRVHLCDGITGPVFPSLLLY